MGRKEGAKGWGRERDSRGGVGVTWGSLPGTEGDGPLGKGTTLTDVNLRCSINENSVAMTSIRRHLYNVEKALNLKFESKSKYRCRFCVDISTSKYAPERALYHI